MHSRVAGHEGHASCTSLITCTERSLIDRLMWNLKELVCGAFVGSWVVQCDSKRSHGTGGKSASCSSNSSIPPLQSILGHLLFTASLAIGQFSDMLISTIEESLLEERLCLRYLLDA